MSTVAVVPNERTDLPYDIDDFKINVEKRVRNVWHKLQKFPALTGVDVEKSDEEQYHQFKSFRLGRLSVRWFTIVERFNLSLWHLDALVYFIFLIILLFGMCNFLVAFWILATLTE